MDLSQDLHTAKETKKQRKNKKFKELVFNMTWLMEILMIQLGEQLLINIE